MKFSPDGKFIKNLFKKGQGPGEIQQFFYYILHNDDIYVYDYMGIKIIHMDKEGELIEEFRFKERYGFLYGILDDNFILWKVSWPGMEERTGKVHDVPNYLVLVSKDGEVEKTSPNFPLKWYLDQGLALSFARLNVVYIESDNIFFVNHTSEYLISVLDFMNGKILKKFNRKYSRVKAKKRETPRPSRFKIPERKYVADIDYLYLFKGNLWVRTSTKDEKKGTLIDVFNPEGQFIDNFYLNLEGTLLTTHEDFIFVREQDEDGNISIAKYKVIE